MNDELWIKFAWFIVRSIEAEISINDAIINTVDDILFYYSIGMLSFYEVEEILK